MPSRPAISFKADAISSACARLSSWHGPAISANGSALPKRALPIVTTGLGPDMARPCAAAGRRSTAQDHAPRKTAPGRCGGGHPRAPSLFGSLLLPPPCLIASLLLLFAG